MCVYVCLWWEGWSAGTQLITQNYIKLVSFGMSIMDWTSSHGGCRNFQKVTHITHTQLHYSKCLFFNAGLNARVSPKTKFKLSTVGLLLSH